MPRRDPLETIREELKPTEPMKTYKNGSEFKCVTTDETILKCDQRGWYDVLDPVSRFSDHRVEWLLAKGIGRIAEPKPESVFRGRVELPRTTNGCQYQVQGLPKDWLGKEVTVVVGNVVWSVLMEQSTDLQVAPGHSVTCHKGRRVIVVEESQ